MTTSQTVFLAELSGDLNDESKYTLLFDPAACGTKEAPFAPHAPDESKAYSGFFGSVDAALEAAKDFIGGQVSVQKREFKKFEAFDLELIQE